MESHDDPIVAEVRAVREALAAKHGNSVEGIFKHLRRVQKSSGREYVRYPARRIAPAKAGQAAATSAEQE